MKTHRIRNSSIDKIFHIVNYSFLTLCFLVVIFPLLNVASHSLSSPKAVSSGQVWLFPVEPTLFAYKKIMNDPRIVRGFINSILYTIIGTSVNLILTFMAAYPLSRKDFFGRQLITGLFAFTMLFSGGLIPTYLLVKDLGLRNNLWAMVIPNALSVWNMVVARTFFANTIPDDLYEAAYLDGCSEIRLMFSIVLPLSGPIAAVMTLFYAVGHWNSYFNALIYLDSQHLFPLQLILRSIFNSTQLNDMASNIEEQAQIMAITEVLKYALIIFASLPLLIIYPFVQKYFVKGVMIGSLKG